MRTHPPLTDDDVEDFHREVDEIKAARVWMNSNGFDDCIINTSERIFEPDRRTRVSEFKYIKE